MKISVCIPMYNESRVICQTARTLSDYMEKSFSDYEIVFCNDGSSDGCDRLVEEMQLPHVRVISYGENRGKGYAVRTAFLAADGDIRMFTDADLAYGTQVIQQVYDTFCKHPEADLVIGSRNLTKEGYEGYSFLRKIMSKVYIKVLCMAGGFRLSDSQCGCKAFSKKATEAIFPRCQVDRFAFDFEAILWSVKLGMKTVEIPVKVIHHGESKVHIIKDTLRMLKDLRSMKKRINRAKVDA